VFSLNLFFLFFVFFYKAKHAFKLSACFVRFFFPFDRNKAHGSKRAKKVVFESKILFPFPQNWTGKKKNKQKTQLVVF